MKKFVLISLSVVLVCYLSLTGCSSDKNAEPSQSDINKQSNGAKMVGGSGSLPPAYLKVKDFKKCLGTEKQGTAEMLCMPKMKPAACPSDSWQQLQGQPIPPCN